MELINVVLLKLNDANVRYFWVGNMVEVPIMPWIPERLEVMATGMDFTKVLDDNQLLLLTSKVDRQGHKGLLISLTSQLDQTMIDQMRFEAVKGISFGKLDFVNGKLTSSRWIMEREAKEVVDRDFLYQCSLNMCVDLCLTI